ncbi:retrovirus-related pol polyprotein from transposon TNT 1-94 [Tanacetum coccineum]|uniref:Retrovirus-related pol polyprotein from transposon TNT 1-94 n=1 Tax=Tanacetum coccineum TaxID=301880 RepID=A0ABQ5DCR5_9ASTR
MHKFYQRHRSNYHWTKDHPLEQVCGNPSKPVQTRRQLATDPEMCMFVLTVSKDELTNIKEAMADHAWIEAMSTNPKYSKKFEKQMHNRFEMSLMGEIKFFLGLQIHQTPRDIFIDQSKYALDILKKNGMDKCDSIGTPMATSPRLDADLSGTRVDQSNYQTMIGSLMYLTSSKPDFMQADYSFEQTTFSDVDHAGCLDTRKSTYAGIQFIGDKLVGWMSKKQDCTAMSTVEANYVALLQVVLKYFG